MTWVMSTAQGWDWYVLSPIFVDFRLCPLQCVSFATHFQRTGGLKSAVALTVTCKESGLSPSPSDKYSGSSSGSGSGSGSGTELRRPVRVGGATGRPWGPTTY
jgi:hypothetical protein